MNADLAMNLVENVMMKEKINAHNVKMVIFSLKIDVFITVQQDISWMEIINANYVIQIAKLVKYQQKIVYHVTLDI